LDLGITLILAGFWRVLAGHIGHARLANRMFHAYPVVTLI